MKNIYSRYYFYLNCFSRFCPSEQTAQSVSRRSYYIPLLLVSVHIICAVSEHFHKIIAREAQSSDNIPAHVLRDCAEELTDVFIDIFNISQSQAVVPSCVKATPITLVPKKLSPSCFNDYRPIAFTSS